MRELAGFVDVDSGGVWVGDPCYVISSDAEPSKQPWGDFCDLVMGPDLLAPIPNVTQPYGNGMGMNIETTYGDGTYPVYITKNSDGRVTKVEIYFDTEEN